MLSEQEPQRFERNYYIVGKDRHGGGKFRRFGEQGGNVTFVAHVMYTYFYTKKETAQQVCANLNEDNPNFIFEVRKRREA